MQDVTKDRDKWIGGSDIPIILNLSSFKTRWQLLQEKAKIVENTFNGNIYTEYGNVLEPVIRDYVNGKYKVNFVEDKIEKEIFRYHADGYDGEVNMVLEVKTTSQIYDSVEDYKVYLVQLLTGMKLYGANVGILAVYERPEEFDLETAAGEFDPTRLHTYIVNLGEYKGLVAEIGIAARQFWEDLTMLKENPFLTQEDLTPFPVIASAQLVLQLEEKLASMKAVEEELKKAKAELKAAMIEYNVKKWETPNGTKITLVADGSDTMVKEFDLKTFTKENPELAEKYMVDKVKKGRAGYVKVTLGG